MHAGLTLLTMSASFRAASSNFPIVMRYSTYSSEFSGRSCEERERERESTEGGRLQHLLHSVKVQHNMMCRVYMLKGHTQTLRCLLYTRMAVSGRLWERANWM